jgi:hypothetical protein
MLNAAQGLFVPVERDPEKCPDVGQELVEISTFFANIGSNSPILILLWRVKVILIDGIEVFLYIQWRVVCHTRSELFLSFAA